MRITVSTGRALWSLLLRPTWFLLLGQAHGRNSLNGSSCHHFF
jgi:hypothetical protein